MTMCCQHWYLYVYLEGSLEQYNKITCEKIQVAIEIYYQIIAIYNKKRYCNSLNRVYAKYSLKKSKNMFKFYKTFS